MLYKTHVAFGYALSLIPLIFILGTGERILTGAVYIFLMAIYNYAIHRIIDLLSHEQDQRGYIVRGRILHSPGGMGFFILINISIFIYLYYIFSPSLDLDVILLVSVGMALSLYSHLLLDLLTAGGIYFRGRKIKATSRRYNDPVLNGVFSFISSAIIATVLILYFLG